MAHIESHISAKFFACTFLLEFFLLKHADFHCIVPTSWLSSQKKIC